MVNDAPIFLRHIYSPNQAGPFVTIQGLFGWRFEHLVKKMLHAKHLGLQPNALQAGLQPNKPSVRTPKNCLQLNRLTLLLLTRMYITRTPISLFLCGTLRITVQLNRRKCRNLCNRPILSTRPRQKTETKKETTSALCWRAPRNRSQFQVQHARPLLQIQKLCWADHDTEVKMQLVSINTFCH